MAGKNENDSWDLVINSGHSLFSLKLKETWRYRDLLQLFIRRNFVAYYKQTILGPLWFFIQPVLTTLMFTVVFGNVAGISTDGVPKVLFYLAGVTFWSYFSGCLNGTASTFLSNKGLFAKVYFPRLITPLSIVITHLIKFGIQVALFMCFWLYFYFQGDIGLPNANLFLFPVLVVIMALLGMGMGLIISAFTTKYRDLSFLLGFGVQLFMYATPVVYPFSILSEKYQFIMRFNPMANIIETFKHGALGAGAHDMLWLLYSLGFAIVVMLVGIVVFNRTERTFIDTV